MHVPAAAIWLLGIAVFHTCAHWTPQWGSAIPSLIVTFALALATRSSNPETVPQ
jgi:hypothetical protein